MKKKVLIIFVILAVLIGTIIWYFKSNQSYYITDNEFLYDEAISYLENEIREESSYKDKDDYQVFTNYAVFGIQEDHKKKICLYVDFRGRILCRKWGFTNGLRKFYAL